MIYKRKKERHYYIFRFGPILFCIKHVFWDILSVVVSYLVKKRWVIVVGKKTMSQKIIVVGKNDESALKLNHHDSEFGFKFYYYLITWLLVKIERDSSENNLLFGKKPLKTECKQTMTKIFYYKIYTLKSKWTFFSLINDC